MKIKTVILRILLIPLPLILVLTGCKDSKGTVLVGTRDCEPPCWLDIMPGVTKSGDMIEILKKKEQAKEGFLTLLDGGIIRWQSLDGYNSYVYASENEVVTRIEVDLRSNSIKLDDLITIFGEPLILDIGKVEDGYFRSTVFYPNKGLAFVISGDEIDITTSDLKFLFNPDMAVLKGIFFSPMEDIFAMINLLYSSNAKPSVLLNIQNWTGYGIYYK
ncbi:MAG: hypothetical protein IPG80_16455 [Anaerolineales bacterium]|uniref:hypothetical protein n=1 Tax=Candidatus Villigracilis vicinus TaxID=3140679 RepID=UPI003136626E|nr:hypothetical protein [Anaerolineales bacterium]